MNEIYYWLGFVMFWVSAISGCLFFSLWWLVWLACKIIDRTKHAKAFIGAARIYITKLQEEAARKERDRWDPPAKDGFQYLKGQTPEDQK